MSAIDSPPEVGTTLSRSSSSLSEASDLDPIIQEIAEEIDLIHKLSRAIPNGIGESHNLGTPASTLSYNVGGDVKHSRFDQSDSEVIQDKFPKCDKSLQKRLAAAMRLRRTRIRILSWRSPYWRTPPHYSDVLSRDVPVPELSPSRSHRESPPAQPASEAKQENPCDSSLLSPMVLKLEKLKAVHTMSRLSWANTSCRRDSDHLQFPPAPIASILQKLTTLKNNHIATLQKFLQGNNSYLHGGQPPIPSLPSESHRDLPVVRLLESKRDLEREWSICTEGAREVNCPYSCCALPSSVAMNQKKWM